MNLLFHDGILLAELFKIKQSEELIKRVTVLSVHFLLSKDNSSFLGVFIRMCTKSICYKGLKEIEMCVIYQSIPRLPPHPV